MNGKENTAKKRYTGPVKTYKFKLYKSTHNDRLHWMINAAGLSYNHCLSLYKRYYRLCHKTLNKFNLQKHMTKEKKWHKTVDGTRCLRYPYLSEIGSQALQNIVDRIANAYHLFFVNLENGKKTSPPKYKKVRKYKSFTLKQAGWKLDEDSHSVYIGKHKYRYFKSREIAGKVQTVTVKRDNLRDLYIYFVCQDETEAVKPRTGKSVGFDFGFKGKMLIASDFSGDVAEPMFIRARAKDLRKACRARSRCHLHTKRWYARNDDCNRIYRKADNQRRDYHFKLAHKLCKEYAMISLETLNMKWQASVGHGKKVSDYGFSSFVNILKYVAKQHGTTIVQVDRFFPSTQICHSCGGRDYFVKDLKIREWECPFCQEHHDRDRNAAMNISAEGQRMLSEA